MSMKKKTIDEQTLLRDCLLCGSTISCTQIKIDDQKKWARNFCKLYDIDIVIDSTSTLSKEDRRDIDIGIENIVRTAFYCTDCHTELWSIAKLYKSIDDINAQLKVIQLQCECKLRNCVNSLKESQERDHQNCVKEFESSKSKLYGKKRKRDEDLENLERKQRLLKCMRLKEGSEDIYSVDIADIKVESDIDMEETEPEPDSGVQVKSKKSIHIHPRASKRPLFRQVKKTEPKPKLKRLPRKRKRYMQEEKFSDSESTHLITLSETNEATISLSCKDCARVFGSKHHLNIHIQAIHTREFRVQCTVDGCDFRTTDKTALQRHLATVHSDARPFVCDICQHTFKIKHYLNDHMKRVHPPSKDFLCDICGKGFSNRRYLQEHEETHKDVKSFLCPLCGREFTQRTRLNIHLRKVHSGDGGVAPGSLGEKRKKKSKMSNDANDNNLTFDMALKAVT